MAECERLLQELARGTEQAPTAALETLLFHGGQVRRLLAQRGRGSLYHFAVLQDNQVVRQFQRLVEIMADEDDRLV